MRTPLLAGLVGALLAAGCINEITGVGDDDDGMEMGSGSGSGSNPDPTAPRVVVSVDKPSLSSDLNVEQTINVTLSGEQGFAGDVTLAVSATDEASAAIGDWASTLGNTTVTLAADGTAATTLKVKAMGDVGALTGTLKVTATSSAGTADASVAMTFNPVLVVKVAENAGDCSYEAGHSVNNPYLIKAGRTIRVLNTSGAKSMVIHTDSSIAGFGHENGSTPAGMAYERTIENTASPGDESLFYCHSPNPDGVNGMVEGAGTLSGTRYFLRVAP